MLTEYEPEHDSFLLCFRVLEKDSVFFLQFDASLRRLQELEKGSFLNMDNKFETYQKRLSIDYKEILHCLDNLGLICTHLVFSITYYQF